MNYALIFAGGAGHRMNTRSKPKQFLELHGKPIIIYTLELFEWHPEVNGIVIVCLKDWIPILQHLLRRYDITKAMSVVPGGNTGHASIYNGLMAMKDFAKPEDVVLIHDGVRPLITDELISENIAVCREKGNAITAEPARESVVRSADGEHIDSVPPRGEMYIAKAPQTFRYGDIVPLYERAREDGIGAIDSAHLCSIYDVPMSMVRSTRNNLKITEPADYYIVRALHDAMENEQIFGL